MEELIAIIGAGIGGLTLAARLEREKIPYRVYEKAPVLGEVGAGLGLWSNAVLCLEKVGVDGDFWSRSGCEVFRAEMANAEGKILSSCDVRPVAEKVGASSFVVHRADLHGAIYGQINPESVVTGKKLSGMEEKENGVLLRFSDGSTASASMVVGADGLRSQVRAQTFGDEPPRYSGQTCYRGIARLNIEERHALREIQGRGLRAAVIPLDDERVYWWTTENVTEGGRREPRKEKEYLLSNFADWAFGVPEAIEATDAEAILRNDLYDRPPLPTWSKGRVTLLGDAAHPTTPNLGQGACMAIEDGFVLGGLLGEKFDAEAFSEYESLRKDRCEAIVKESRRFGWIGGWENPAAVKIREFLLATTPETFVRKSMEKHIAPQGG